MGKDWVKGNQPVEPGLYWITVQAAGGRDVKLALFDGKWYLEAEIIAFMPVEKPKAYDPGRQQIGFPDYYCIRVKDAYGNIFYYARNGQSVHVSKKGYLDIEKAARAARRARKADLDKYPQEKRNYAIVDGNGNVVKVIAKDIA